MANKPAPITAVTLAELTENGWRYEQAKISKTFIFRDFGDAMGFMARCMPEIEKLDHHPEWLNVYDKVTVGLTTHDTGGVTVKDGELAVIMDRIAAGFSKKG